MREPICRMIASAGILVTIAFRSAFLLSQFQQAVDESGQAGLGSIGAVMGASILSNLITMKLIGSAIVAFAVYQFVELIRTAKFERSKTDSPKIEKVASKPVAARQTVDTVTVGGWG